MIRKIVPNLNIAPEGVCRECGKPLHKEERYIGSAPRTWGGGGGYHESTDRMEAGHMVGGAVYSTMLVCDEHGTDMEGVARDHVRSWMKPIWVERWQVAMAEAEAKGWMLIQGRDEPKLNPETGVPYFIRGWLIPALHYEDGKPRPRPASLPPIPPTRMSPKLSTEEEA